MTATQKTEVRSSALLIRVSGWYDRLFTETNVRQVERVIINFALAGFGLHLLLILLAKYGPVDSPLLRQLPTNFLKTIYTPFSIILFYEVLTLVLILPRSVAIFIGKQYEIITLIAIRSFFHDIADYDLDKPDIYTLSFLREIGVDLIGAALLFFLTILYYRIFARARRTPAEPTPQRTRFVHIKKAASLILTLLLLILSITSLTNWLLEVYHASTTGGAFPNPNVVFYKDFFSVMIFVDVFLLILSFIYTNTYDVIFRNAGFVISTILVRIALTAEKPFTLYFALTAVLFGVLLVALFVFYNQRSRSEGEELLEEAE